MVGWLLHDQFGLEQLQTLAFVVLVTWFLVIFWSFCKARLRFLRLQRDGMPMPPYSLVFGHLLVLKQVLARLPKDIHGQLLPNQLQRHYPNLGPIFYLDLWPFNSPLLVVASPEGTRQFTQDYSLPKFPALHRFLRPLAGKNNLITLAGESWKTWRGIFNRGFSRVHLLTLVPEIVDEAWIFRDLLLKSSLRADPFPLNNLTANLAIDVIGRVVLDTRLESQSRGNDLVSAIRGQMQWLSFGNEINPFKRYNPVRGIMHIYYSRCMNNYLSRELEHQYSDTTQSSDRSSRISDRSIVKLALKSYSDDAAQEPSMSWKDIDHTFKATVVDQIKTFLFAGHDTTSTTLCYAYYLLHENPDSLRRLREEHGQILGETTADIGSRIRAEAEILNKLPYTAAVIKETLRLFPPASSTRAGEAGFHILDERDRKLPTEGFLVWSNHYAMHRDAKYWPEPEKFYPERWLVPKDHRLHPISPGAWRPFELGPRACIGQDLSLLELKIVLAVTITDISIKPAYKEWDEKNTSKGSRRTVSGERAYQMMAGGARPSSGFPCRVTLAANPREDLSKNELEELQK